MKSNKLKKLFLPKAQSGMYIDPNLFQTQNVGNILQNQFTSPQQNFSVQNPYGWTPPADIDTSVFTQPQDNGSYITISDSELSNPTMQDASFFTNKEQQDRMLQNKASNTYLGNYDEDGQVIDTNKQVNFNDRLNLINPYGGVDPITGLAYGAFMAGQGKGGQAALGIGRGLLGAARIGMNAYSKGKAYKDGVNAQNNTLNTNYITLRNGGEVTMAELLTGNFITNTSNPNIEIEEGEYTLNSQTGQVQEAVGEKHENGGIPTYLPPQSKVLSDYDKVGRINAKELSKFLNVKVKANDTYAGVLEKYSNKIGVKKNTKEEAKLIEKAEDLLSKQDNDTKDLNSRFLQTKFQENEDKKEQLNKKQQEAFQKIFNIQEASKPKEKQEGFFQDGGTTSIQNERPYGEGMINNWWNSTDFSSEEKEVVNKDFNFIHNWYQNRKNILDEYGNKVSVDSIKINTYPDVTKANMRDSFGVFDKNKNSIILSHDFIKSPHIYTHEINHKYQSEMGVDNRFKNYYNTISKYNPDSNKHMPMRNTHESYLNDPAEIHSRLMQLRQLNNLKPSKFLNEEDVKKLKGVEDLQLDNLSSEQLMNILNQTVNNYKSSSNLFYAQQGGEVNPQQILEQLMSQGMSEEEAIAYMEQQMTQPSEGGDMMYIITQALQQGANPEEILAFLVEQGYSQEEAVQVIQQASQPQQTMQAGGVVVDTQTGYTRPYVHGERLESWEQVIYPQERQTQDSTITLTDEGAGRVPENTLNFYRNIQAIAQQKGLEVPEYDLSSSDQNSLWAQMQQWVTQNAPQELLSYTKSAPLTNKGVAEAFKQFPDKVRELGIDPTSNPNSLTTEQRTALAKGLNAPDEFYISQFNDGLAGFRFPTGEVATTQETTETVEQTPPTNEDNIGAGNITPQRETINRLRNVVPMLPNMFTMPPSAMQIPRQDQVSFNRITPTIRTPEVSIAQANNQANFAIEQAYANNPNLAPFLAANLLGTTQQSANQAIAETDAYNAQAINQANLYNAQAGDKEQLMNINLNQNFEQRLFGSLANQEADWRRFFTNTQLQQRQNWQDVNNLNLMNQLYPNFQSDGSNMYFSNARDFQPGSSSAIPLHKRLEAMTEKERKEYYKTGKLPS